MNASSVLFIPHIPTAGSQWCASHHLILPVVEEHFVINPDFSVLYQCFHLYLGDETAYNRETVDVMIAPHSCCEMRALSGWVRLTRQDETNHPLVLLPMVRAALLHGWASSMNIASPARFRLCFKQLKIHLTKNSADSSGCCLKAHLTFKMKLWVPRAFHSSQRPLSYGSYHQFQTVFRPAL